MPRGRPVVKENLRIAALIFAAPNQVGARDAVNGVAVAIVGQLPGGDAVVEENL